MLSGLLEISLSLQHSKLDFFGSGYASSTQARRLRLTCAGRRKWHLPLTEATLAVRRKGARTSFIKFDNIPMDQKTPKGTAMVIRRADDLGSGGQMWPGVE